MADLLSYKTLREENSAEFIINKSRFIGYGCPCQTEEEALALQIAAASNLPCIIHIPATKISAVAYHFGDVYSFSVGVNRFSFIPNDRGWEMMVENG